ncbi:CHAT domain-containing protein [Candidatus Laterigemmans baculatus]|uniref:CHAT domain-containing protein n=1 Tax=Candidatus Laterigemmans baculatus TaxID=2770505 RepID=UPI0013DBC673|nr:CHAT domain-containing protein [Candidatus Laterigemmans baculatus]
MRIAALRLLLLTPFVLTPFVLAFAAAPAARAQDPGQISYPAREYYLGLQLFREGSMAQAGEAFELARRRGRRDPSGRWIDSIPAHAMLGEVQYQLGNLVGAEEHFAAALNLMLVHEASLASLDWPRQLLPAGGLSGNPVPWAPGGRRMQPAAVPDRINVAIGELNAERVLRSGGAFQAAQFIPVDGIEILRAVAISAYRRSEILGPLAGTDPLTGRAAELAQRMVSRSNAVAAPLWQTVYGLLIAGGDGAEGADPGGQAATVLQRASVIGSVEHPLTPLALLGTARRHRDSGQTEAFRVAVMEASVAAALFDQPEWVGEAVRVASGTLVAGADEPLRAAAVAIADTYARRARFAAVAANVVAADCAVTAGNRPLATNYLGNVQTLLRKRDTAMPRYEATAAWVQARLLAASGQPAEALLAATRAVAFGRGNGGNLVGAPSLLQRNRIAAALESGAIAGDKEEQRLAKLLEPPSAAQWARDPIDALAAAASDPSALLAARLARSVSRSDAEAALPAADALLRSQVRAALPVGGRPLDLRWLIAAPLDRLGAQAGELRKNLPGVLGSLQQGHLRASEIRDALAALPLASDDAAEKKQATELWKEMVELSDAMEATTLAAALDRMAVPEVFPPAWAASEERRIVEGSAVVSFVPLGNRIVGIAALPTGASMWLVENSSAIGTRAKRLLADIGVGRRRAGQSQLPSDDAWRSAAVELREALLPADKLPLEGLKHLVIVPSGPLWYLPFELLPVADEESALIGNAVAVSYAPTPGLAIHPPPDTSVGDSVGYVTKLFFAPKVPEEEADWVAKLRDEHETSVSLPESGSIPGRFISARLRTLWVAAADQPPASGPAALQSSPLIYDAKSNQGSLAEWMRFPWGAPRTVLLPGFRSRLNGDGSELFYTAIALHAAGTPEALLARWPVGGVSTATMMSEMLQELPNEDALSAWRRAVQVLRGSELDPTAEPLLSEGDRGRVDLTGDEPLFWTGYMVLQGLPEPPK